LLPQPALSDGLLLDLVPHRQDYRAASVTDIGGRQVGQGEQRDNLSRRNKD